MLPISTPSIFDQHENDIFDKFHDGKLFSIPFTEHDVLELQAIFVTQGMHIIKTHNIHDGRKVVITILNSLKYYHNIGCISDVDGLPKEAYNIINHILLEQCHINNAVQSLEDFFTNYPCFDFIWVEFSKSMKNKFDLHDLQKIFNMFHVQESMPILVVEYEDKDEK